jgi:hypothetical protein
MSAAGRPVLARPAALFALVIALVAGLAACSGVPGTSRPQTLRTVGLGNGVTAESSLGPVTGAEPRDVVAGFLRASAESVDARHSVARQFLTADAGAKWQDSTVTIVSDDTVDVAQSTETTATVAYTYLGRGSLDARGIYLPEKNGTGVSPALKVTFALNKVKGQWRISDVPPNLGVIINVTDFQTRYSAHPLYFYDSTETQLVPDIRYSALSGHALATWLLGQMLGTNGTGPRPELVGAVQTEIPDGVDATRASVTDADPAVVEIPGSSQLDGAAQKRLAAELAYTIGPIPFTGRVTLSDGGKVVDVPTVGTVFQESSFPELGVESVSGAVPYYLRRPGALIDQAGRPVPGPVGAGTYALTSIALRQAGTGLLVAGLSQNGLLLGAATGPLTKVSLASNPPRSALSVPEFDPLGSDLWIGVGGSLYRVTQARKVLPVSIPAPTGGGWPARGQIEAVRFSPDGARLAVVFRTADGSSTALWIGAVSRSADSVSVPSFLAITPAALQVADVAWEDDHTLLTVAAVGGEARLFSMQSDGSQLEEQSRSGLPGGLVSVAAATGEPPLVSTENTVWIQVGSGVWRSFGGGGQIEGYAPAYAR